MVLQIEGGPLKQKSILTNLSRMDFISALIIYFDELKDFRNKIQIQLQPQSIGQHKNCSGCFAPPLHALFL